MGIKIQELIDIAVEKGVSAWVEYDPIPGFEVQVEYIGKEEMFRISDISKKTEWKKHQRIETTDRTKLSKHWAKHVLDWRGLTLERLQQLIPIQVAASEKETEVPCDEENKYTLLHESVQFDVWLTDVATDPAYFIKDVKRRKEKAEELKK